MIDTQGTKSSEVSSRKQLQTSSIVYKTGRRISSEDRNNIDKGTTSVGPRSSHKVASDITSDLDNLYDGMTNLQALGIW